MPEARWFTDNNRMTIHASTGRLSLLECEAPQGAMPPLHVHHDEDETFYVLEGRVRLFTPGGSVEIGPGESATGPRGVPHAYRVESDGARMLVLTNGAFASFVEEASVPASGAGYAPADALLAPEALGAAAAKAGIEVLGPPGLLP